MVKRMQNKPVDIKPLIEGLMGEFYDPGSVEWRYILEGEVLQMEALIDDNEAKCLHVMFRNGVRQVGPAGPFEAIACAQALMRVRDWMEANSHGRPK